MGQLFRSYRDTNIKHTRIDTATGRNKRDKGTVNERRGIRPERHNGRIISRADWRREQKTGVKQTRGWSW
jgi:hypothetical protein